MKLEDNTVEQVSRDRVLQAKIPNTMIKLQCLARLIKVAELTSKTFWKGQSLQACDKTSAETLQLVDGIIQSIVTQRQQPSKNTETTVQSFLISTSTESRTRRNPSYDEKEVMKITKKFKIHLQNRGNAYCVRWYCNGLGDNIFEPARPSLRSKTVACCKRIKQLLSEWKNYDQTEW